MRGRLFASGIAARHCIDPRVLAPIAVVLVAVMVLACVVPVRRAINLNPVDTLRQD